MKEHFKLRFSVFVLAAMIVMAGFLKSGTAAERSDATRNALPVFKIKGKMIAKVRDFKSGELAQDDVIEATIATDTVKWRMLVDSTKNPRSDSFFDGQDTYFCRRVGAFLPGHKVPGDEKITYTASIYPENKSPTFGPERMFWIVFCSRQHRHESKELPAIWNVNNEPGTTNFISVGDKLDAIVKATYGPDGRSETRSELEVTKRAEIGGVSIPKVFRWKIWSKFPPDSEAETKLMAEWTFEADRISLGDASDLSYPAFGGIGSVSDMRIHEFARNRLEWNNNGIARKVSYEWPEKEMPTRDMTNLFQKIPPLIYRGVLVERGGKLVKVEENDPSLRHR